MMSMNPVVQNATLVLALGRRYGLVGRNGTGKTTFLRALASKSIKGIPDNVQVRGYDVAHPGQLAVPLSNMLGCWPPGPSRASPTTSRCVA